MPQPRQQPKIVIIWIMSQLLTNKQVWRPATWSIVRVSPFTTVWRGMLTRSQAPSWDRSCFQQLYVRLWKCWAVVDDGYGWILRFALVWMYFSVWDIYSGMVEVEIHFDKVLREMHFEACPSLKFTVNCKWLRAVPVCTDSSQDEATIRWWVACRRGSADTACCSTHKWEGCFATGQKSTKFSTHLSRFKKSFLICSIPLRNALLPVVFLVWVFPVSKSNSCTLVFVSQQHHQC